MILDIQKAIYLAACGIMVVAIIAFLVALFSASARAASKRIFMEGLVCSLLLWYISWLIG